MFYRRKKFAVGKVFCWHWFVYTNQILEFYFILVAETCKYTRSHYLKYKIIYKIKNTWSCIWCIHPNHLHINQMHLLVYITSNFEMLLLSSGCFRRFKPNSPKFEPLFFCFFYLFLPFKANIPKFLFDAAPDFMLFEFKLTLCKNSWEVPITFGFHFSHWIKEDVLHPLTNQDGSVVQLETETAERTALIRGRQMAAILALGKWKIIKNESTFPHSFLLLVSLAIKYVTVYAVKQRQCHAVCTALLSSM